MKMDIDPIMSSIVSEIQCELLHHESHEIQKRGEVYGGLIAFGVTLEIIVVMTNK